MATAGCGGGGESPNGEAATASPPPDAQAPAPSPSPSPSPAPAPGPAPAPDAATGRLLYQTHCLRCHGVPPDRRVISAAGDPEFVLQAIAFIRPMNFLAGTVGIEQARPIALWLQDPR